MTPLNIGWLGLGNMGAAMAARLVDAGHRVTVWNRSPGKAEPLLARGARWAETPALAASNDFVVTMLADDQALRDVLEGAGALAAMSSGAIHLSMSTISRALAIELTSTHRARGVELIGCPVFGRPDAAAAGKLFILAAGSDAAVARARPLYEVLGQKVLPLGSEPQAAHLSKILGNFLLISSVELLAEALDVAHSADLDPDQLLSALTGSVFSAPFYANYGKLLVAQRFDDPAAFSLPLARKDLDLALAAARSAGAALPAAELVREKVSRLVESGGAELDLTAIGKWTKPAS
jgi:3-hydroxyisobutyrate dehydrogenase-like beta-hydroxyacid dehydrogenase